MNSDLSPKALTEEKNLWTIYLRARAISFNRFNFWSTILILILVSLQYCVLDISLDEKLKIVREFSNTAIVVVVTVLGFLLAGFTIFATISQPEMLVAMSKHRHEKSQLSYLKHNFFVFVRVFIYFLIYTVFCLLILVFAVKGGLVYKLAEISPISWPIKQWLVGIAYVGLYVGMFFLLMQLKSFIFNVYHSVMTAIRWKATS